MIQNIEFCNQHKRLVVDFTLTSQKLEETIRAYAYTGENRIVDSTAENAMLPPIVLSFYFYVFENDNVPSPEELVDLYLSQDYFKQISEDTYSVDYETTHIKISKEGLMARIMRTYPSLVRDMHFYLLAVESNKFQYVYYSSEDDFSKGIDLRVSYNDKKYDIALFQKTRRSELYRDKKRFRHSGLNDNTIDLELDSDYCKHCGDYYLYTQRHVEQLLALIQAKENG